MLVNADWVKLVQLQVPRWMRRKRMIVWLLVCISQVRALHAAFLAYRTSSLYSLRITGQTIYLEKALNDRFDFVDRLIYIETVEHTPFFLHNKAEAAAPLYFYNKYNPDYAYNINEYALSHNHVWRARIADPTSPPGVLEGEWEDEGERIWLKNLAEGTGQYDFIIWVPVGLVYDQNELRALVALYKLAGKRYVIQTY